MQQQFYLHSELLTTAHRQNVKPITLKGKPMICLTHDNQLELYQYAAKGISFSQRFSFCTYIAKTAVLPNKHQLTDYLFIVDHQGAYAFWSPSDLELYEAGKSQNFNQANIFSTNTRQGENCTYCSETHRFEVLDTRGWICFNIQHSIVVIDYSIKNTGLRVQKSRRVEMDLIKFSYLSCLQNSKHHKWLGVIQQVEEKTFFKVYNLDKIATVNPNNHISTFEKINLLEFTPVGPNQVLLLSADSLILATVQPFSTIARYKVHDNYGKLLCFDADLYGYVGEEFILVSKTMLKSYGSFQFNKKNILEGKEVHEAHFLRTLEDGGKLISVATDYNEVFFITLYQKTWKLCSKLASLGPIFSLHETNNPNWLIAVTSSAMNKYAVSVVQRQVQVQFFKEEESTCCVDKIVPLNEGRTLLMCSKDGNQLMQYNQEKKSFEVCRREDSLKGQLLAANEHFYITSSQIYTWEQYEQLTLLQDETVRLVALKGPLAIYLTERYQAKQVDLIKKSRRVLREASPNEYFWNILHNFSLVVAQSDRPDQLFFYKEDEFLNSVELLYQGIISSVAQVTFGRQDDFNLAIGYVTGRIVLLNSSYQSVKTFDCCCSQVVNFFSMTPGKLGVFSGNRQFVLFQDETRLQMKQMQLSYNRKNIHVIAYSEVAQQLIFAETESNGNIIKIVQISDLLENQSNPFLEYSYRFTSLCELNDQIPIIYIANNLILVGVKQKVMVFNLLTGNIEKQLKNFFTDVIGIEPLPSGVLIYGVDELHRNILMLISLQTLEVIDSINLILKDSKYIKSIKTLPEGKGNLFVCRGEKFTTVYQLSYDTNEATELYEMKTDYQGYSLDLDRQHKLLAETDSFRFISVYTYDNFIAPVCRYVASSQVNDLAMMSKSVLYGDKMGELSILEYDMENPFDPLKMLMTKVASLRVGEEVSAISKLTPSKALYGTFSGKVGKIAIIDEPLFRKLKAIELKMCEQLSGKNNFPYKQWKNRNPSEDKLIDGVLIEMFLRNQANANIDNETRREEYCQILHAFKQSIR